MEMRDYIVSSRTLWSGVMNYIKASAQNAEALKPWAFREEEQTEEITVLVFKTTVDEFEEQGEMAKGLNELVGNNNWTIDLDDVDRVLRIIGKKSSTNQIISLLNDSNYICEMMK
jgi:hypothetical protein